MNLDCCMHLPLLTYLITVFIDISDVV